MTPEQFKALGLKEGDPIHVTIKGRVTAVEDPAEYRHPLRLVGPSGSIFWVALDDVVEIKIDDTVEAPLAVGDRIWHKNGKFGESKEIKAIVDVGGVPHAAFPGWGVRDDVLVCGPVSDYVRAKA